MSWVTQNDDALHKFIEVLGWFEDQNFDEEISEEDQRLSENALYRNIVHSYIATSKKNEIVPVHDDVIKPEEKFSRPTY